VNPNRKEVTKMTYTKPDIAPVGLAIHATQQMVKTLPTGIDHGGPAGSEPYNLFPAYEVDE
jgi:hypothetical protein